MAAEEELDVKEETEARTDRRGNAFDPEILIMSRIIRILDDLDQQAQSRVMAYLSARYEEKRCANGANPWPLK